MLDDAGVRGSVGTICAPPANVLATPYPGAWHRPGPI